jgi:hypothetical protein
LPFVKPVICHALPRIPSEWACQDRHMLRVSQWDLWA